MAPRWHLPRQRPASLAAPRCAGPFGAGAEVQPTGQYLQVALSRPSRTGRPAPSSSASRSVVIARQWSALTRFSADVPVSIPWLPIGAITGGCAAIAVVSSVLPAWRLLRLRVVELADLSEQEPPPGRSPPAKRAVAGPNPFSPAGLKIVSV